MSEFGLALSISMFVLVIFIAGFWLGVSWQEGRNCFVCGERWEEEHRHLEKEHFIFSKKKEGRPMVDCYRCKIDLIYTPIMGDLVGNRS